MKKAFRFIHISIISLAIILSHSCNKDLVEEIPPEEGTGTIEELPGLVLNDVEKDEGEIGITLNTREIAKKGYTPHKADISVQSSTGEFSRTGLIIDAYTNMVNLSYKVEDLTDNQEAELREGVDLSITVKDINNQIIETKDVTKTSFTPSPAEIVLTGSDLQDLTPPVSLRSDVPHYLQFLTYDKTEIRGAPGNWRYRETNTTLSNTWVVEAGNIDYENNTTTLYYFAPIEGKPGVFSISVHDGDKIHYVYINRDILSIQNRENLRINGGNTDVNNYLNYQFKIERAESGTYTITPLSHDKPLLVWGEVGTARMSPRAISPESAAHFRILSFDIDWNVQSLDTRFESPILPASNTESAFNSTLKNCSSGALVQTVGQSETLTSTKQFGWEETMSMSSRSTYGLSVTTDIEVGTQFFGVSGNASLSTTGNYEFTREITDIRTNSSSVTTSESVTISTERSITVPAKKATRVTDLYQTYENVRIPFVQRFRIRGTFNENGASLSGPEIMSQFHFNGFSGVITEVASDYIEVTVKGSTTVDKLIDTRTSAEDVNVVCGG